MQDCVIYKSGLQNVQNDANYERQARHPLLLQKNFEGWNKPW